MFFKKIRQKIRNDKKIKKSFSKEETEAIAKKLNINFNEQKFNFNEFFMGVNVELEHGKRFKEANVTNDDPILTGKIALAHLLEFPDYYTRLKKLETDADKYWKGGI